METISAVVPVELEKQFWLLYRDFFDKAEKKRRWNVREDIPWDECNPRLKPVIADVVETFCAIELYLPDYNGKILPVVRNSRGRAWFYANWGYEESKHSLALGDWMVRSGARTEEYLADLEKRVFEREWNLPQDSHLGMLAYAMVQEEVTFISYRNLNKRTAELGGDGALEKLLSYLTIDEKAHHAFFRDCLKLYLEYDRPGVINALREVMHAFQMPAISDLLDDSKRRVSQVQSLELFHVDMYYSEVYLPILNDLGISRQEMRPPMKERKSTKIS